jgi:hypothetical protein
MPHRAANAVDAAAAIAYGLRGIAEEEMARGGDPAFDPPFTTVSPPSTHRWWTSFAASCLSSRKPTTTAR